MRNRHQGQFLSAAYNVLSRAGRSMHYTQITSVAVQLGLLNSGNENAEIAMSSLLSQDIRTNQDSLFAKKRPGVYMIADSSVTTSHCTTEDHAFQEVPFDQLRDRTGLSGTFEVFNKALYLTVRTLDISANSRKVVYRSVNGNQFIEFRVSDLVDEFHRDNAGSALPTRVVQRRDIIVRSLAIASRLSIGNPQIGIRIALFLLDLAMDVVGQGRLLVIESGGLSIKVAVKSGRRHAFA